MIISLITPLIGLRAVVKGEFKPQRITRFLVLCISSLFVGSLFFQGERHGLLLALVQWINSVLFFIISLRIGVGGKSWQDIFVLFLALGVIFIWKTTNDPVLALYLSIAADFVSFWPTIIKSFRHPYTEDPKFYASDMVAGLLNLLTLKSYNLQDLAFPGYIFLLNTLCMSLILISRKMGVKLAKYGK